MAGNQDEPAHFMDVTPLAPPSATSSSLRTRGKYTSKACIPCRQSKTKCAGGSFCQSCRRQGKVCTYPARARVRKAKIAVPAKDDPQSKLSSPQVGTEGIPAHETEAILDRLRSLEQQISGMDKALHGEPVDLDRDAPCDTEIFATSPSQAAPTSLSSHINALKKALIPAIQYIPQSPPTPCQHMLSGNETGKAQYLRNLPTLPWLKRLINLYFEQLNYFFPCVDEVEFRKSLSQIEKDQARGEGNLCLLVKPSMRTFLMLMCMVLAVASYLDPGSHQDKVSTSPGWKYLLMAEDISIRDYCSRSVNIDLDLVRYHTVKAIYLIHIERLTAAYRAIGVAIQLAFSIGLNDECTWRDCSGVEKRARRLLWWTIFYVDRRVAQKCWKPYTIRETEIMVGDVEDTEFALFNDILDMEMYSEMERRKLINRYVQTEIIWARLWTLVWDSLFAVRVAKGDNAIEEIEVLDARILHAQRQTHESLRWDTSLLPNYVAAGETEAQIRSRLVSYVVGRPVLPPVLIFHNLTLLM
ncbi:uncharacterized protein Z518_05473 [Rhinocladiella mackenziei CBS 650.93]|uniref:Rhinocladiella mackenziei CBS 650.93 unplaced genomic scaffold supercont1.4, whole genome shotgun sequence n=1 Tax=Rhinocladiella mackenziei CBS 650.93 TaxID=1442369 RepID=A0A0D2H2F8_9EURO|nr:uncharacterized protein Z518_05473 [Rhinocladiella mackenziei CBS 650.93]KIX04603.1 hypothetical protein Z518_05473 [Rhinocladiella mackenziei CBS 650.93]